MPILARAFILLLFTLLVIGSIVVGIAVRRVGRKHDLPPPPIARATAPDEIARGGRLFRTNCLDCHAGHAQPTGTTERRPIGARVTGAPEFMGEVWAPNLTVDPAAGIGGWTDGDIARLLRNGLRRDGSYAATMPRFARLADQDVAALIGFLRSNDPLVAASPNQVPRPDLPLAGTLALAFAASVDVRGETHVPMPPRGPTAAYGGYLASVIYGCVDCHTDGFIPTEEKLRSPVLLAGGLFHRTPRGETIYSTNLTPDPETGIGGWTVDDLARALSLGIGRNGLPVRAPMPVFRYLDPDEAAALFAYLRAVPAVNRNTPGPPRVKPTSETPPAMLFATLGCSGCHGDRAPYQDLLKRAAKKPITDIVAAIRNPEASNPATQMPTYGAIMDEATATRLAAWIQTSKAAR